MNEVPDRNLGVLLGRRPEDYVAGTLDYEVRVPNGDWRPFLITEEKQYSHIADAMDCVSESYTNCVEIQYKHQTGSEINFSARALAKLSGTTKSGNYLYKVADEGNNGLILEHEWPTPPGFSWDTFYAPIPADVLAKRRTYDTGYEWIAPDKGSLQYHLKHAPIQIIITKANPNHAVTAVALEGDTVYYFDSYPPHLKKINIANLYGAAMKIVINANNNMVKKFLVNDNGKIGVMVLEGFTGSVTFAKDPQSLENLKSALEFTGSEPTVNLPQ
jgi:hypothetical protein